MLGLDQSCLGRHRLSDGDPDKATISFICVCVCVCVRGTFVCFESNVVVKDTRGSILPATRDILVCRSADLWCNVDYCSSLLIGFPSSILHRTSFSY